MMLTPYLVGVSLKKKDAYTTLFGRYKLKKKMLIPPHLAGISLKKKDAYTTLFG